MPLRGRSRVDLLVVCTGNVCRSPYIAARLAHALPDLVVRSAGTSALVGAPAPPEIERLLDDRQVERPSHVGHQLTKGLVRRSALVVTAERPQRIHVLGLARQGEHSFALRELARALVAAGRPQGIGVEGVLRVAVESAAHDDGRDYDDDIVDPYGQGPDVFAAMAAAADESLDVLIPALGGRT